MAKKEKLGLALLLGKKMGKDEDDEETDGDEGCKSALEDAWKAIKADKKEDFVEAMLDLLEM